VFSVSSSMPAIERRIPVCPNEFILCLTSIVAKICWCFYAGTLPRRLTRSRSIAGALSMAIYQSDSNSTVWERGGSSLLWWKVLGERKKFDPNARESGHRQLEKFQPLADQRVVVKPGSGDVATGPGDAMCNSRYNRIVIRASLAALSVRRKISVPSRH
jgi:hypothetical protein